MFKFLAVMAALWFFGPALMIGATVVSVMINGTTIEEDEERAHIEAMNAQPERCSLDELLDEVATEYCTGRTSGTRHTESSPHLSSSAW